MHLLVAVDFIFHEKHLAKVCLSSVINFMKLFLKMNIFSTIYSMRSFYAVKRWIVIK